MTATVHKPVTGLLKVKGLPTRWITRFTTHPSGIYDCRTVKHYNSNWARLGELVSVNRS